jgi:ubiquinone/menaquinone biosynthesis C-methylase UbiE/uncharacterized protein YbaR (Trm112 family)
MLKMSDYSWLGSLHCPFCGGDFEVLEAGQLGNSEGYTVLNCFCGSYPVVAGIPILMKGKIGHPALSIEEVTRLVKNGEHRKALFSLLVHQPTAPRLAPSWLQNLPSVKGMNRLKRWIHNRKLRRWQAQAEELLTSRWNQITACDLFDFYFRSCLHDKRGYEYFAFRFGQPRHLVAMALATLIQRPSKPILDLGCGFGQITRSLVSRSKEQGVIGLDHNFFALYVAKNRIAPEAEYICCEADKSLPFADGAFSFIFCSNSFHFFQNKQNCVWEIKRLAGNHGVILLVSVRNGCIQHETYGTPLPPAGYRSLLADMPHLRMVADSQVLDQYLQKQGPQLARSTGDELLTDERLLSIVASHKSEVFLDHDCFEDWPHAEGILNRNPLYIEGESDEFGNLMLVRRFPSAFYEWDHADCKKYLPEKVWISSNALTYLKQGKRRTPELEKLIEQCVVLGMPEHYL